MRRLALVLLLAAAGAAQGAPRPAWTVFADCAGAYVANSRVADPDRPASMVGQMDDVARDYAKAARGAYRRQAHVREGAAHRVVEAHIAATADRLAKQPRAAAEHVIDACPQT